MDSGTLEADVPSFVDANRGNFFSVARTGDDARDFVIGEVLANQALTYSQSKGDGELIALAYAPSSCGASASTLKQGHPSPCRCGLCGEAQLVGKQSPQAPDPAQTISAPGQWNSLPQQQQAMNMVSQDTPCGSLAYNQTGATTMVDPKG